MRDFNKFPENLGESHGSPYDRGAADAYYWRPKDPHYYPNGTGYNPRFGFQEMTNGEIYRYHVGYADCTDRKDCG
jgi:hypothetical protein